MIDQIVSKLNNNQLTNFNDKFNQLTKSEKVYLESVALSLKSQNLKRSLIIAIQRAIFLKTNDSAKLLDYLLHGLESTKYKFDELLTAEQRSIVAQYVDDMLTDKGCSYIVDNHIIPFDKLNFILLHKYKTAESLRKHKLEISNRLTTATCLDKYGKARVAGNASPEHMKYMAQRNSEWQKNLEGEESAQYWKKRSEGAKRANASRTYEEQLIINEKNRLSNIRTWNNKSEEEKQRIRERGARNGLLAIQHPRMCAGSKRNSKFEEKLLNKLHLNIDREYAIKYADNHLFKYDFRIDNLLIDINPVETHNSSVSFIHLSHKCIDPDCTKHPPEPSRYHFNRWKVARDNGYELISIFDWMDSEKVIDFISFKIGKAQSSIGARKCEVRRVNKSDATAFINAHHLLGFPPTSQIFAYGLYNKDELVSLLVMCRPRYKKDMSYDYELLRFVSSVKVSGGLQKLWKFFLDDKKPTSVLTYTDNNIGNGFVYRTLGFSESSIEPPTLYWENLRYPQYKFQAKVLARQGADIVVKNYVAKMGKEYFHVGMDYNDYVARGGKVFYNRPNDSEDNWIGNEDIARFYEFVKIYDCGNTRWSWYK